MQILARLKHMATQALRRQGGRLLHDNSGGALIIGGFAITFIFIGMFAMSLDHGRNYMYQSDLQGKLKNYAYHLAEEYTYFRTREAVELKKEITQPLDSARYVLWERPNIGNNGGMKTEPEARQKLEARMAELLKRDPLLKSVGTVIVTQSCSIGPASNRSMLLNFTAKLPQANDFNKPHAVLRKKGSAPVSKTACSDRQNISEPGCIAVDQTIVLPISCDPAPPPPITTFDSNGGSGGCDPWGGGELPKSTAPWTGAGAVPSYGGNMSPDAKVAEIVFSLDAESKIGMGALAGFANVARLAASHINMSPQDLAVGATLGNLPVANDNGGGVQCVADARLGHSGSMYDNKDYPSDGSGPRACNQSRIFKFDMGFWAQHVRRCQDTPIWTYESKQVGDCWEERDTYCEEDPLSPGNCCGSLTNPVPGSGAPAAWERRDRFCKAPTDCVGGTWLPGNNACCEPGQNVWGWTCKVKNAQPVYKGLWYASCPKSSITPDKVYVSPIASGGAAATPDTITMTFKAFYSKSLNGSPQHTLMFGPLDGTIINQAMDADGQLPRATGGNELRDLKPKNSERTWIWGCRGPAPTRDPSGRYGLPYGDAYGVTNPLVTSPGGAATPAALNTNCQLATATGPTAKEYTVRFLPTGCGTPNTGLGKGCDMPEGFYRVEMDIAGLRRERGPTDPKIPPGGITTNLVEEGGNGWAFNQAATVPSGFTFGMSDASECPVVGTPPRLGGRYNTAAERGATVLGDPNNPGQHVKYAYLNPAGGGNEEVVSQLPAERLNIATVSMERRHLDGRPYACYFDTADNQKFISSPKAGYVFSQVQQNGIIPPCNTYPWFCSSGPAPVPPLEEEHPFWNSPTLGIMSFENNGKYPLGVSMQNTYSPYRNYFGDTDNSPVYAGYNEGMRQLAQVQALNMVRVRNTDYPPNNMPIGPGRVEEVIAAVAGGYGNFDITNGHVNNQCALLKAGADKLGAVGGGNGRQRSLIFVGRCNSNSANFNIYPHASAIIGYEWSAHGNGNPPGKGFTGMANLQLTELGNVLGRSTFGPSGIWNPTMAAAKVDGCFAEVAQRVGFNNLFIVSQDASCTAFANASNANDPSDQCAKPFCILGLAPSNPNYVTPGDCAARMLNCVRKTVRGG